ncbi:histidine kinase [Haloferula sp.]|uniref:histidine kinase n=1 Tax=Haloferula sp. TaxID=2497595 RepID=UPI003C745233
MSVAHRLLTLLTFFLPSAVGWSDTLTPYSSDEHTLHLWHLDEAAPPFKDSGRFPTPLLGLLNGAKPGQPSIANLKNAVSFNHHAGGELGSRSLKGAILTISPKLHPDNRDNAPSSFKYFGDGGAFTYEALLKFDLLPADAASPEMMILSMDDDIDGRIFSLLIDRQRVLTFAPMSDSGSQGGALAAIPTEGLHAINTEDWFHVAITYNGIPNLANNVQIYWTRISPEVEKANRIGSGTLIHDFNGRVGDFAIGNEARQSDSTDGESSPFPGRIDEVRISSVARNARDFILVPPGERIPSKAISDRNNPLPGFDELPLFLANVLVDGESTDFQSTNGETLVLEPGLHRLDFDFTYPSGPANEPVQFHCQLEGVDENWRESTRGMSMVCQVRNGQNQIISEAKFNAVGSSKGWENSPEESIRTSRAEPLFIPSEGRQIYIAITSGSPDTTGTFVIDDIDISLPGKDSIPLWQNGDFSRGDDLDSPLGLPQRWSRRGSDPSIAQVSGEGPGLALTLSDGDQTHFGEWACIQNFDPIIYGGRTVIISWSEAYNIIGGSLHRATYVNVPPGSYKFRAIGLTTGEPPTTASLSLPIVIRLPIWQRPWFLPALTSAVVALCALYILRTVRRRNRRRMRELAFQNALERDRTRIARDMHDDLGTRITVLNLSASMALRELDRDPESSRRHLGKLNHSARDLVVAMDDLVWAVDPAHDSLDQLASHLTRLADEIFRDSPIRCRLDIPSLLPPRALGSDFRHQLSLSVKEALHNVLRHAGPCEVRLSLKYDDDRITITIADDGKGFETSAQSSRHGLAYLADRLKEIGGTCTIDSSLTEGTRIVFDCPLKNANQPSPS